jgi:hypothetical protein
MKARPSYDPETGVFRVPLDREGTTFLVSKDLGAMEHDLDWLASVGRYEGPFDEEAA